MKRILALAVLAFPWGAGAWAHDEPCRVEIFGGIYVGQCREGRAHGEGVMTVLDVAFPEGATSGPPVLLPDMDALMVTSAARWRAYIAAHCVAWIPGTTRAPVVRGRRRVGGYTWARDVSAYPVLTLDDMRRLAFGNDRHTRERSKVREAFRDLPGLVVLDEHSVDERTGEVGFRVVPDAAAEAVGRKG